MTEEEEIEEVTYTKAELADMAELLRASNDQRVEVLEHKSGQPDSLLNAFDAMKMLTYLEHILGALDIVEETMLDFEGRRQDTISQLEKKLEQMLAAKAAAERQQKLTGGPVGVRAGKVMRPGPGGIVRG